MSAALIAAAFGFALPHVASYRSVWASLGALSWPYAVLVATASAFAGPRGVWLADGVGLCAVLIASSAFQAWRLDASGRRTMIE